jgi:hypothetical protein
MKGSFLLTDCLGRYSEGGAVPGPESACLQQTAPDTYEYSRQGIRKCNIMAAAVTEFSHLTFSEWGTADGGTVVKVLCYKAEGRWFGSRWCHWNFPLT